MLLLPHRLGVVRLRRGATFEEDVCTEIEVRILLKDYACVIFHEKGFFHTSLQVGRSDLIRVE